MTKEHLDKWIGKGIGYKHLADINPEIVDKSIVRKIVQKPAKLTKKQIKEINKVQKVKTMSSLKNIASSIKSVSTIKPIREKVGY